MNFWVIFLIFLIILMVGLGSSRLSQTSSNHDEGFIAESTLGYSNIPYKHFPSDRRLFREWWGPYLWGWENRPSHDYGPNTRAPYPYQFECDNYATHQCESSCDPFCYKKNYLRCAAGVALVNPEPFCS
jgi:hypothetical protein